MKHIDKYNEFLNESAKWDNFSNDIKSFLDSFNTSDKYSLLDINTECRKFKAFRSLHFIIIFFLFKEIESGIFKLKPIDDIDFTVNFVANEAKDHVNKLKDNSLDKNPDTAKKWREKNKDSLRAKYTKWRQKNKEYVKATELRYREENKEYLAARNKEYRLKNKDAIKKQQAGWYQDNKEYMRKAATERRDKKLKELSKNPEELEAFREKERQRGRALYNKNKDTYYIKKKEYLEKNKDAIRQRAINKKLNMSPDEIEELKKKKRISAAKRSHAKQRIVLISILNYIDTIINLPIADFEKQLLTFINPNLFQRTKTAVKFMSSITKTYLYEEDGVYNINIKYIDMNKEDIAIDLHPEVWPNLKTI